MFEQFKLDDLIDVKKLVVELKEQINNLYDFLENHGSFDIQYLHVLELYYKLKFMLIYVRAEYL